MFLGAIFELISFSKLTTLCGTFKIRYGDQKHCYMFSFTLMHLSQNRK